MNRNLPLWNLLIFTLCSFQLFGQCPKEFEYSTLHFNLNACNSNTVEGTNSDFSEFTAVNLNPNSCSSASIVGGNLYRINPEQNTHSCTSGFNGTPGMCVSSSLDCTDQPNSPQAIRFDVALNANGSDKVTLTEIKFYEAAPLLYSWINGSAGQNNYPTRYSVRVSVDGNEIFYSSLNETTPLWTLESFDFSQIPGFTVQTSTIFNFELLGFCPVGNGAGVSVWDIDELSIKTSCSKSVGPVGGNLAGGPFEFCVGDGQADMLAPGSIVLSGNAGSNSQWVVTDSNGTILGLPGNPSDVNFDGAGAGTCLIWHLSYEDGLSGAAMGNNAMTDLDGCYALSNPISVVRSQPNGGTLAGGPFEFCVGDNTADMINDAQLVLSGATGTFQQLVITDINGNILGLPPTISAVNFDGAGLGTCLIWNLSYEEGLQGAAMGNNANQLSGCFNLSNPIEVNRVDCGTGCDVAGGTITGGPFEFCVGDGVADMLTPGSIALTGNTGMNSQWVVTDPNGTILGLPPVPSAVNFDGAGAGTCLIWHLSFEDGLTGAAMGNNAMTDLDGCYSLSNPISVVRSQPIGGTLAGGPFEFCVGDDVADMISDAQLVLSGATGTFQQLVITDSNGNILGLPPTISAVNFDGAGVGTCLIWNLSYEEGLQGAAMGNNANQLTGCFSLSNPVEVNRVDCGSGCDLSGGTITGGPFEFCVGDGMADMLTPGSVVLAGNTGMNSQWVVTDPNGTILGLPPMPSAVNFDGAGAGTCLIWHLSFEDGLTGAVMGNNAMTDLDGCFSLSNPISVVRSQPAGGTLAGGPFEFCVGDGDSDMISDAQLVLSSATGTFQQIVITDINGNILGLPPTISAVDFDGAGVGTCLIWNLSYEEGLQGAMMGNNANQLTGCFSLSNPIEVNRIDCGSDCEVIGGMIAGGPFEFCVGDGVADMLSPGSITLSGNSGMNSQWVVTDLNGTILGLPPMPSAVNFDGAGPGTCLIWHLSFDDGLVGAAMGNNAMTDLQGCFSLSNPISVVRSQPNGGMLSGGPFEFCVGDSTADFINDNQLVLSGNTGTFNQLVITDINGNILGLPPTISAVDFDGAGIGTCLIWNLSYEDGLEGAMMGNNADQLSGCFSLSNPIEVVRTDCGPVGCQANGGILSGGPFGFCVGDGIPDHINNNQLVLAQTNGAFNQLVITDTDGVILGLPGTISDVNFDGAGAGNCLIWNLSYEDGLMGAEMGNNAMTDLQGCYALSNPIQVARLQPEGGELLGGPFQFCIGDGGTNFLTADQLVVSQASGSNSQWVITDPNGTILGLPTSFTEVDFEAAGVGTCLIWHLSYEDGLSGAVVGNNANQLQGCFDLSNPVEVVRNTTSCVLDCPTIEINSLYGIVDQNLVIFDQITGLVIESRPLSGDYEDFGGLTYDSNTKTLYAFAGRTSNPVLISIDQYTGVITEIGEINQTAPDLLDLTVMEGLEFNPADGLLYGSAGSNTPNNNFTSPFFYQIDTATGNATFVSDLSGSCQNEIDGLAINADGQIYFIDGCPTPINFGTLDPVTGVQTVIGNLSTNLSGGFIAIDPATELFWGTLDQGLYSFNELGEVTFIGQSYTDGFSTERISGLAFADRTTQDAYGGIIVGEQLTFCVGDGIPDHITADDIEVVSAFGKNYQWVVTALDGEILGLPANFSDVNFDGAGVGTCLLWYLSYEDGLQGAAVGANANELIGCYDLSNPVVVNRVDSGPACDNLNHSDEEIDFMIFPNPITDQLQVELYFENDQNSELTILNSFGKLVYQTNMTSSNQMNMDLSNLPSGTYWLSIKNQKAQKVKKFVKF